MNLQKMLAVAQREYSAAVRSKSFIIGLVLMPIWMSGGFIAQKITQSSRDTSTYYVAIVDRTPGEALYPVIEKAVKHHNTVDAVDSSGKPVRARFALENIGPAAESDAAAVTEQRMELSNLVRRGELLAFVEIGPKVLDGGAAASGDDTTVRYSSNRPTFTDFASLLRESIPSAVYQHRFASTGLSKEKLDQMLRYPNVSESGLMEQHSGYAGFESNEKRAAPLLVSVVMVMLLFMVTIIGTSPMVGNVIEEKQLRIAEVLLGGIRPFDLMMGKLVGGCGVSLTLAAVFIAGGYGLAWKFGMASYLTAPVIAWFLFFMVVTTFLYGSVFAATGSACTNIKEAQAFMAPVMLLLAMPLFFLGSVIQNPAGGMAVGLSMFPLSAPTAMMLRVSMPPGAPMWQPIVSGMVAMLTTIVCVWAAGRIFRVGILMQGKGANYATVARWIFRG